MRQHHSTDINYKHMQGNTILTYTKNIRLSVYVDGMKREKERKQKKGHGRLMILTIMKQSGC